MRVISRPTGTYAEMALHTTRAPETASRAALYPLLRQTPLRKFVSDAQLRELERYCERATRAPGATLYRQGDAAGAFYIVVSGSVELRARPPGRRVYRTVEVVEDGCSVGDESVVGEEQYLTSARVQDSAQLLSLPLEQFEQLRSAKPDIALGVVRCAGSCLVRMVRRSAILTQAPADVALDLLLRELAGAQEDGHVRITHAQLAGLLHLSRETVSRMLGQMAAEGRVSLSRGVIRVRA
jgi:CRP/FNR family transcriptional regulator, cyclic AMP receptor protein